MKPFEPFAFTCASSLSTWRNQPAVSRPQIGIATDFTFLNIVIHSTEMRIALWLCFFLEALTTIAPAQAESAVLRASVTVDFGRDVGQNLGTLAEFRNRRGEAVCSAGFAAAVQTRRIAFARTLEFFCRSDAEPRVTPLGRVGDDVYRPGLSPLNDAIVENPGGYISRDGVHWSPAPAFARAFSVQTVNNSPLVFRNADDNGSSEVQYEGRTIARVAKLGRAGLYYRGRIVISFSDNTVLLCAWTFEQPECGEYAILPHEPVNDVYAMIGYGESVFLGGGPSPSSGKGHQIFVLRGKEIKKIYESSEPNGQVYAFLIRRDRILFGEFPGGFVYKLNPIDHRVERLSGPPGPRINLHLSGILYGGKDYYLKRYREAQSIAFTGGRVFVGMFPWGQLLWSHNLRTWASRRLPSRPARNDLLGFPYRVELERRVTEMLNDEKFASKARQHPYGAIGTWGQRISALVPMRGGLIAAIGNATGLPYDPAGRDKYLTPSAVEDYGKLFRIETPGSILVPFAWPSGPITFTFEITRRFIRVLADGIELGRAAPPNEIGRGFSVVYGKGLYGRSPVDVRAH